MNKKLLSEILELSPSERILLVQDIWDSLAESPEAWELTEDQKYELDKRLAALERDPKLGIPWDDVIKELKASR